MKKVLALVLAVVMLLGLAACSKPVEPEETKATEATEASKATEATKAPETAAKKYTIGICQYMPHPALDAATKGFKEAVVKELGEDNVTFDEQNAAGEASNCATIVNGLVSSKVDLIMANATPAVAAAYNATETIPILGTSVTEYGAALGIKDFTGTVGGNVSGTSDLADLDKQAQMILDWFPNTKKVALLYCSGEANSQFQVDKVAEYLKGKNVETKMFGFADTSDMMAVTQSACDYADVIYVPTDNTVANNATAINQIAGAAKKPVIAGESGICSGCGVATMSIDYYDLGYATGMMAVKILRDGADIAKMPIEYAPKATYLYNEEICNALGVTPLEGYEKLVVEG